MSSNSTLAAYLRENNQSVTKPRQLVFDALRSAGTLTMHDLIRLCAGTDRASIYRIVTLFEQLGIVLRIQRGWKYSIELSDKFQPHHHHATCVRCNAHIRLPEDARLEQQLHRISTESSFTLQSHQLELQGLCKNCST